MYLHICVIHKYHSSLYGPFSELLQIVYIQSRSSYWEQFIFKSKWKYSLKSLSGMAHRMILQWVSQGIGTSIQFYGLKNEAFSGMSPGDQTYTVQVTKGLYPNWKHKFITL